MNVILRSRFRIILLVCIFLDEKRASAKKKSTLGDERFARQGKIGK